ncbi:MAG: hypothetical protein M0000_05340 [Actinomycetota bacterium]|nr:hypothetical protein [Actinomycetota bacterium]
MQQLDDREPYLGFALWSPVGRDRLPDDAAGTAIDEPLVQFPDQFQPSREQALSERLSERAFGCLRVLAEILQVLAVIECVEELLVVSGAE